MEKIYSSGFGEETRKLGQKKRARAANP